jgi:hypothetical protein
MADLKQDTPLPINKTAYLGQKGISSHQEFETKTDLHILSICSPPNLGA